MGADVRRLLLAVEPRAQARDPGQRTSRSENQPRPWNLKDERAVGSAPPSALWATDPAGFGQVGCVYTRQGFEYDWNGVLIGPDLVSRTDRWVAVRSANRDPDFRNPKRVSDQEFDALVRNVYKVLLSRGMRGTLLYSTDAETQTFLERMVTGSAGDTNPT